MIKKGGYDKAASMGAARRRVFGGALRMVLSVAIFLGSAAAIYLACEFFVNGVEWVGRRARIGGSATATLLAAFGTALPESVVTFVAVAFGRTPADLDIGIGAALGGPLVLSTLAYAVLGVALLLRRRRSGAAAAACAASGNRRDRSWFILIFAAALAAGRLDFPGKAWVGVGFLAVYGLYVRLEIAEAEDDGMVLEPLRIRPRDDDPALVWAALQTSLALIVIFVASRLFVGQMGAIAAGAGLSPQLAALLLSPVATEMPETMNAIIWVRQGRPNMAIANITGAMMIQATLPTALGLFFTPWRLDPPLALGAATTLGASVALYLLTRTGRPPALRFAAMGLFYLMFLSGLAFL